MNTLMEVFDKHLPNLVADERLYKRLLSYRLAWSQKSDIYIEFLGSNLTGVHPIRYSTRDEDDLFIDILNVDKVELSYDISRLPDLKKVGIIATNNVLNTLVYLMHRFIINKKLPSHIVDSAIKELYYIFAFKIISSIYSHYFKFDCEIPIAKAVVERLNDKYLVKKIGTWQKVIEYRSLDVRSKGIYYPRLVNYNDENATYVIQGLQGRIRDIIKNVYIVMVKIMDENSKIRTSSNMEAGEDGEVLKDITAQPIAYSKYINNIVRIETDFINDDVIYLITNTFKNVDRNELIKTLKHISSSNIKNLDFIIDTAIISSIKYLNTKNIYNNYNKQVVDIIKYLKSYLTSSNIKDKNIVAVKAILIKITKDVINKKTNWVLSSISVAVILYIFLRALYGKKI